MRKLSTHLSSLHEIGKGALSETDMKALTKVSSVMAKTQSLKGGIQDSEAKRKISKCASSVEAVVKQIADLEKADEEAACSECMKRVTSLAKNVEDSIAAAE